MERLIDHGDFPSARETAEALKQQSLKAGEDAYEVASYDIALAHWLVGRVLRLGGVAEAALEPLKESLPRFQKMAKDTLYPKVVRATARMCTSFKLNQSQEKKQKLIESDCRETNHGFQGLAGPYILYGNSAETRRKPLFS